MKGVLHQIMEVDCALAVTYLVGSWAVRSAHVERGYLAVGSEWLLVMLVFWGTYKALRIVFDRIGQEGGVYGEGHNEKRDRGDDRMRHHG